MRRGFSTTLIDLLKKDQVISEDDIAESQKIREQDGGKLEDILVNNGFVESENMLSYRALALETVPIHVSTLKIPDSVIDLVPMDLVSKHKLIPVSQHGDIITVAMANPLDIDAIDEVEKRTNLHVIPMISSKEEIENSIKLKYKSSRESVSEYLKKVKPGEELQTIQDESIDTEISDLASLERLAEDAPVIGLVDLIIRQAIDEEASDVHIEVYQDRLRIRFRVDGILHEVDSPPKQLHAAVVSRIKIMSNMDIAERRVPQDGRLKIRTDNGNVNLRVSSLPTAFGEKIVMRIADESTTSLGLEQLGMPKDVQDKYIESIESPYGMILVTGPTGSGKTSTLYASLNRINKTDVNIITIEDPVEYLISGLNQVEINHKAGRTFPSVLRSILRQDPDIIMVGEIRDFETAELAVEAALTGHLVFSTLHTNNAPSAISRLLDLDVQPFLISASVTCVIAQRLVRKLCPNCKKPYKPSREVLDRLKLPKKDYTFYEKNGCSICDDKGYKGRTGVYEVMFMDDEIRELTSSLKDVKTIQQVAIRNGMRTLRQAALDKVIDGITSLEEAFRATSDH
ncbi:secretion system protein E [Candidatus Poribacteria bacterium]|nr:secretion system protein E [Candidatus Poribacteria bacterium]